MTQLMRAVVTPRFLCRQDAVTIRGHADGCLRVEPVVVCCRPERTVDGTDFGPVKLSSPFVTLIGGSQADGTDDGHPCTRFSVKVSPEAETVTNGVSCRHAADLSSKIETVIWPQDGESEEMTLASLTLRFTELLRTLPLVRLRGEPVDTSPAGFLELRTPCPVNPYTCSKADGTKNCRWLAQSTDVLSVVPFYPGQPDNPYGFAVTDRLGRRYFVPVLPHFAVVKKRKAAVFELGFLFAPLHEDGCDPVSNDMHLYAVPLATGLSEAALIAQIPMWRQRICMNQPPADYRPIRYVPAFDLVMANTVFSSAGRLVPERLTEEETAITAALLARVVTRIFPEEPFDENEFSKVMVAFTVKEGMPEALEKDSMYGVRADGR